MAISKGTLVMLVIAAPTKAPGIFLRYAYSIVPNGFYQPPLIHLQPAIFGPRSDNPDKFNEGL